MDILVVVAEDSAHLIRNAALGRAEGERVLHLGGDDETDLAVRVGGDA